MVFFGVLAVSCRIYRSSRKKPDGCSLDPLRTLSIPSPYQVLAFAGFAIKRCCVVLCECCVMCYVVCSSLYCVSLSVGGEGGNKILGGDKGAAPPRAQAPSPCRVGLAPSLQATYLYQEVFFFRYWHKVSEQNDTTFRRCPRSLFGIA